MDATELIDAKGRVFTRGVDSSGAHYITRARSSGKIYVCCLGSARAVERFIERKRLTAFKPLIQTRKKP